MSEQRKVLIVQNIHYCSFQKLLSNFEDHVSKQGYHYLKHYVQSKALFHFQKDLLQYLNNQGSGLGLVIVKESIERLDSEIQIISKMGKGTTFYFDLKIENSNYVLKKNPNRKFSDDTIDKKHQEIKLK